MRETVAANGLRPKSNWYVLPNLGRWLFILITFTYLLAVALALFEALKLQTLVKSLAGDETRARAAMLALNAHSDWRGGGNDLPYAAMMVSLDKLKAATGKLGALDGSFEFDNGDEGDGKVGPKEGFAQDLNQLQLALGALRLAVNESTRGIPVATSLADIGHSIERLKGYSLIGTDPPPAGYDEAATAGQATPGQAVAAEGTRELQDTLKLQGDFGALIDQLEDLHQGIETEASAELASQGLEELRRSVASFAEVIARKRARYDQAVPATAHAPTIDQAAFIACLEELKSTGTQQVAATDPNDGAPSDCASNHLPVLESLSERLAAFEGNLIQADPELARAKVLSAQIVAIDEAAAWLGRMTPGPDLHYRGADGDQTGSPAVAVFNQQKQLLSDTATELQRILGGYTPALAVGQALGEDPEAQFKAGVIWSDFQALERFEPVLLPLRGFEASGLPPVIASLGLRPQGLATLGNEVLTLILVLVIGAIGSLIFMTKRQLSGALQGAGWTDRPDVGFAWYLFRPIFGVVVAFAIYLMYKAGQIALGGDGDEAFAGINVPILSVIALFAGLLSWQALDMIEGRGRAWLGAVERRELWATGLDNALRSAGRSLHECADHIGRTVGQVERWIGCRDKVTPEMQDRLTTWMERSQAELFSDHRPDEAVYARPMWASGLQRALTSKGRALDAKGLAEILDEEPERVEKWLQREMQVSPAMQWRIIEVLGARHSELFEAGEQEMDRWAVGLRRVLHKSGLNGADDLARRIGADTARVRAWMELQERVPLAMQGEAARVLGVGERELFAENKPDRRRLLWPTRLRDRMQARRMSATDLAKSMDVAVDQVHAWLDLDLERGQVAPATQERLAEVLDELAEAIFGTVREGDAFRWATGLGAALQDWGRSHSELAGQIDSDPRRVERWIELKEPVPPAAQRALEAILSSHAKQPLFSDQKPG